MAVYRIVSTHHGRASMRATFAILALLTVTAAAQSPAPAAWTPAAQPAQAAPAVMPSCPEMATALRGLIGADPRNRDWANVARYREANKTVKDAQVVFMGDSITDNWQQPRF